MEISLIDTDIFESLLDILKDITSNEKIDISIREDIRNRLEELVKDRLCLN